MRERREYVRSNGLVLVNYKGPGPKLEGKSSAFDVCGGGLRITVDKKLNVGTLVELEIFLPGSSQPIMAKGEVVWTEEFKTDARAAPQKGYFYAGIKFTAIDENSRKRISEYVQRKLQQGK